MFEGRGRRLLPPHLFRRRMLRFGAASALLVLGGLGIGALGYHALEGLPWIDATLNAAMILGGMGPVDPLRTEGGKLFAAGYALFSGLLFLVAAGVLFAPIAHRFLHRFHLDAEENDDDGD